MNLALLRDNPLLLLFLVAGTGFVIGRVRVFGVSLGVAAVLFAGLFFGALDPSLALPELVPFLGLVLFVYTIGLSSGPGFFASLAGRGLRNNGLAIAILVVTTASTIMAAGALKLASPQTAGLFAGASTNTPALAAVLDALRMRATSGADAVVAYSIAYPMGVLAPLLAIVLLQHALPADPDAPPPSVAKADSIENCTVRVAHTVADLGTLRDELHIAFGRVRRGDVVHVVREDDVLQKGDLVTVVGLPDAIAAAVDRLGTRSNERIDLDRKSVDYRRIFVSDAEVTRTPLRELGIGRRFDAVITRLRRGDVELLPDGATELELGDRIRVIAPRERLDEVSHCFGDSYKALSEIDVITFSLGIAVGLLLGKVPIPLPGGAHLELGLAGGPLIAGLLLGRLGRVGPLVFTPPYSANLTLRQLGLLLFLAGVGTRAGWSFATALRSGTALPLLGAAFAIAFVASSVALLLGRFVFRIPRAVLLGVVAGTQTQPAVLAFASEQTKDDVPSAGYATVYPLVTIAKIVLAQAMFSILR